MNYSPLFSITILFLCVSIFLRVDGLDVGIGVKFFNGKFFTDSTVINQMNKAQSVEFPALWFDYQRVNHFDPSDKRRWSQKYFVNSAYQNNSCAFLTLGGEWTLGSFDVSASAMFEMAKKFGCIMFAVEHRFYGESHPTNDASVENLKLLTSQQALSDFALFIEYISEQYRLNGFKLIVFGCSYAGNLAAWSRAKYPHLIYGAVSSSAPVLAKFDFDDYYRKIGKVVQEISPNCYRTLDEAFTILQTYIDNANGCRQFGNGWALKNIFGLCKHLDSNDYLEVQSFFLTLTEYWASVAQYNDIINGVLLKGLSLEYLCEVFLTPLNSTLPEVPNPYPKPANNSDDLKTINLPSAGTFTKSHTSIEQLGRLVLHLNKFRGSPCTPTSFKGLIDFLKQDQWTSLGVTYSMRQWIWQTCVEFAYFQTLNAADQPFGHGLNEDFNLAMCEQVYDKNFDEAFIEEIVNYTNTIYGGKDIKGTLINFVNGGNDPWEPLGIVDQTQTSNENFVAHIKGQSHCANVYGTYPSDPQELIEARQQIAEKLAQWLGYEFN